MLTQRMATQNFNILIFGLTVISLAVSTVGVWMAIRIAHRVGMMDVPNERSSHSLPTPRMGGVPMVAAVTLSIGGWMLLSAEATAFGKGLLHAFLFSLSMSFLGFLDDLKNLCTLIRFMVQIASATLALWILAPLFPELSLGHWAVPAQVWIPVGALWTVWMLNLYNFMDGIDGLAGGEAAVASSFFFIVFSWFGEPDWAVANLVVAAASMGFLVHNWPPARIFMGDAGSAFLGAFYGMQSIAAALSTQVPFLVLILPFFNFIFDTTVTLFRRILCGERWYQAHRSHFYQRMINLGMSHRRVTFLEMVGVAGSCAAAGIYLHSGSIGRGAITGLAMGVYIFSGVWVQRKERELKKEISVQL